MESAGVASAEPEEMGGRTRRGDIGQRRGCRAGRSSRKRRRGCCRVGEKGEGEGAKTGARMVKLLTFLRGKGRSDSA